MKRLSISGFTWLAAIVIIIFLCCPNTSWGQTYGEADFSRRDCFTRDNLVACWDFLTAEPEGDLLQGAGDFEGTWNGTNTTCTDCPTGTTCACVPSSDIEQETANIYSGSNAVKITTDAAANSALLYFTPVALEKNTAYQFSFWIKGSDGTEDMYTYISTPAATNIHYVFTTDIWQVAFVGYSVSNMGTAWVQKTIYVLTDNEDRSISRFYFVRGGAAASQTWYLDNVQIRKLKSLAPVSDTGIALEMPVTSDPSFDDCKDCQSFRGQPGDYGTTFSDGKSYLKRADDDTFDPVTYKSGGSFTTGCRFSTTTTAAGFGSLMGVWNPTGNQRSWFLIRSTDDAVLWISDDGTADAGHITTVQIVNKVVTNVLHSIVASYTYEGVDGSADINMYLDENNTTSALADGPPASSTSDFTIGAYGNNAIFFSGYEQECCVWADALSDIELNKWRSPYFPGNSNGPGFYVDTCTQAASHATCSWDNCREGTPTACQAEGTGVMAVFGQFTGIQDNNSFGTNTNTQDNPTFIGFTYTENAGDGTANVSQYFGESKHGDSSLRIKLTGTTSYAFVGSTCNAMLPNTDYYAYVGAKCRDGKCPTNARVYVLEYSDASCIYNLVSNSGTMSNLVTSSWKDYGVQFTSAATTNFYKIGFEARNGNADVLFDNLDLKEASHHTPWVHVPSGGGAVTYNVRDYRLHNPLSDYIQSEGKYGYEDGFCIGGWVWTDWAGDDGSIHYISAVQGTAGNNNRWYVSKSNSNFLQFPIFDSAGSDKTKSLSIDSISWTANNWKYIEVCSSNTGTTVARHYNVNNLTWYSWSSSTGVGTGIQNGQTNTVNIGQYVGTSPLSGYFGPFKIGPYSAVWPMYAWDKRPTKKPY